MLKSKILFSALQIKPNPMRFFSTTFKQPDLYDVELRKLQAEKKKNNNLKTLKKHNEIKEDKLLDTMQFALFLDKELSDEGSHIDDIEEPNYDPKSY